MADVLIKFFQHPFFLPALLAVLIPLVIEWLLRRRRRRITFAAMRFLQDPERPKKIRMQDRILLVLRMVILGLIVLALARPLIRPEDVISVDRKDRSVVLLFDATYSNGQRAGNETSFERARRMALEVLGGLPEGVPVTIGIVGHSLKVVQDWTADKGLLTEKIERLAISHGSGRMRDGLAWALDRIREKTANSRGVKKAELYVFSDMQAVTWTKGEDAAEGGKSVRGLLPKITERAQVFMADTGGKSAANLFVTRFEPVDKVLAAGVTTEFLVEVQTASLPAGQSLPAKLTLFVNDEKRHFEAISVPSGGRQFHIPYRVLGDGEQLLRVVVEGDESPLDNERLYLAEIPRAMKVLLLDDQAGAPAHQRPSAFWEYAVAPPSAPGREPVSAFTVKTCTWQDAQRENFGEYGAIVLADIHDLPEGLTSRLQFYVREGGSLLVLAGERVEPFPYEALYQQGAGPLPALFKARQEVNGFLKSLLPSSGTLEEGAFRYYRPLAPSEKPSDAVRTLAQLSNGQPLALVRAYGQGQCALLGLDPGLNWSRLPLAADYPVFVQELLRALLRDPNRLVNLNVGATFTEPVLIGSERLLLKRPDGGKVRILPEAAAGEELPRVSYADTDVRGLYEIEAPPGVLARRRFVVNLNTDEGDMARLDEGEFRTQVGRGAIFLSASDNLAKRVESMHALREFGGMILVVVLVFLLLESFLAMRFGLRKG
jgi:hypothetical protein